MDIGEVLTVTVRKFWKFKVFWLLGGLAAVVSAVYLPVSQLTSLPYAQTLFPDLFGGTEEWVFELGFEFLSLALLIAVSLVSIPLFMVGVLGVTVGVVRAEQGGADGFSFMELLRDGLPFFWRALGVRLVFLVGVMIFVAPIMVLVFLVSAFTMGIGMLCLSPLTLLLIPVSYVAYSLMELAETAVVADDLSVFAAISKAWGLFRADVWILLLMALLVYLGVGLLSIFFILPFILPMYLPFFSFFMESQLAARNILLVSMACMCIATPFYALAQGVMLALQKTAWVQTYLALSRKPAEQAPVEVFDVGQTA